MWIFQWLVIKQITRKYCFLLFFIGKPWHTKAKNDIKSWYLTPHTHTHTRAPTHMHEHTHKHTHTHTHTHIHTHTHTHNTSVKYDRICCQSVWRYDRQYFERYLRCKSYSVSIVSSAEFFGTSVARQANLCLRAFRHANFNCICPAIQRAQGSGFPSEGSSWLTACMSEQRRFWRDCADAQAPLNLRCSHRR